MRVAIVGGGVASELLLDQLLRNSFHLPFTEYILFKNESIAPACTNNSTAIVAFRGVEKNVSALGDEIHAAALRAFEYYKEISAAKCTDLFQIGNIGDDRFNRRFKGTDSLSTEVLPLKNSLINKRIVREPCYLISPVRLLNELKKKNSQVIRYDSFVKQVERGKKWKIKHQEGEDQADVLIFASGIYQNFMLEFVGEEHFLVPIQGSYLEFDLDLGSHAFSLGMDKMNLVYRGDEKLLLLGTTTGLNEFYKPIYLPKLRKMFDHFIEAFPQLENLDWEKKIVRTGIRARSRNRKMQVEKLSSGPDLWLFNGFHKYGFSWPLEGAERLINSYR